ncbi:hypothetical protein ACQJBY_026376 [Aegilops geniculata]
MDLGTARGLAAHRRRRSFGGSSSRKWLAGAWALLPLAAVLGASGGRAAPPPPPPPASAAVPLVWPRLPSPPPPSPPMPPAWPRHHPVPRPVLPVDEEFDPSELCIVRRSQSMEGLEGRLQLSMVAYAAGARKDISPEFILEVLQVKVGIEPQWVSVHRYRPVDFLIVFARPEHRNRLCAMPVVDHRGVRLFFRQWNRQAQAVHSVFRSKVWIELEGIPPHAWELEVVERILGSSCLVDAMAPETSSRADLSSFKVTAWTADPEAILTLRWLGVPEPGLGVRPSQPALLQYKVLVHLVQVQDFAEAEEPWFLGGGSPSSGQSGLPDSEGSMDGGGGAVARRRSWQFAVRDSRGGPSSGRGGSGASAAGNGRGPAMAATDWKLPAMEDSPVVAPVRQLGHVSDRIAVRT